jgi:hypothetical protein
MIKIWFLIVGLCYICDLAKGQSNIIKFILFDRPAAGLADFGRGRPAASLAAAGLLTTLSYLLPATLARVSRATHRMIRWVSLSLSWPDTRQGYSYLMKVIITVNSLSKHRDIQDREDGTILVKSHWIFSQKPLYVRILTH